MIAQTKYPFALIAVFFGSGVFLAADYLNHEIIQI
jgi:hypothetical protein